MSRERLSLIDRLLRLRRLDEERESAQLRGRVRALADSETLCTEAEDSLAVLAARKLRSDPRLGLDLSGYQATLVLEASAIGVAQAAEIQQQQALGALRLADERHGAAAAATRVSESRKDRLSAEARRDEEMKDSDRLADLRAATAGNSP